jgi:hypothetical protein
MLKLILLIIAILFIGYVVVPMIAVSSNGGL